MIRHWEKPPWHSSYQEHNYGDLFYSFMRVYRPKTVVELGTKAGYSAYHMARGLKANGKGRLYCYDLWGKYPFHHVDKSLAEKNLKKYKEIIKLKLREAVGVHKLHKSVDVLHVDISNEGGILEKVIPFWIDKVKQFIIIEGGSKERDKVDWMAKYNKVSIRKWLAAFNKKHGSIEYFVIEPFPSVTIISKKQHF